jgi:riboflavin kinase/FMN adenylyltransferase
MKLCGFNAEGEYAVAIGKFGILHQGHKKLIETLFEISKKRTLIPAILSFHPSPAMFFLKDKQKYGRIFSFKLIQKAIKHNFNQDFSFFIAKFNKHFASQSPEEFINFLYHNLKVRCIIVGKNFYFGKNRGGDVATLSKLCKERGIMLEICELIKEENSIISTTYLRNLIQLGEVRRFNELTAFKTCYSIEGKVQRGMGLAGEVLGFKTANIALKPNLIFPKFGVYRCKVFIESEELFGIVNIGIKPTISMKGSAIAEVHILNFDRDIYGKKISLELIDFIREERKFASLEELKRQIRKDIIL